MSSLKEKLNLRLIREFFSRKIKLQTDILFESIAILSISIALIIGYSYYSNTKAIIEQAQDHLVKSTTALKGKIVDTLKDAENVVNIYTPLLSDVELEKINDHVSLINSMGSVLNARQYLTTVYFGTPQGYFWELSAPRILENYMISLGLKIPDQTTNVIKVINSGGSEAEESEGQMKETNDVWYYVKNGKTVSKPHMGEKTGYDNRKRGWYIETSKGQNLYWTNIYVFASTLRGEAGITAAKSIYSLHGEFKGVFAVDMTLKSFSEFLASAKISDHSVSYVVDDKNKVVANSLLKPAVIVKDYNYNLSTIEDFGDPVLQTAMKEYQSQKGKENFILFTCNNVDYMASIQDFPKIFQNDWKAVVIAPLNDFVSQVKQNRNDVLKYSVVILLVAFSLSFLLARRISKPITILSEEANKIKNLDFKDLAPINSRIKEIIDLNNAMMSLKSTIQSFSYYIPKTLVKKLILKKQAIQVGGRSKEVSLMFTDIAGFTNISEEISADKLVVYLSEYFEELTSIIMANEGTVDKYIGDAIMSFWGAPLPDRHHAYNACRAALLCQRRLEELNRIWKREGRPAFNTRMGVHSGEVIVGNIGSSERMNYTAIGDSVNLSSRLEGLNKYYGTKIIVSETVHNQVKDRFLFRTLDSVAVKGKKKAIKIYELVGQIKGDNTLYPADVEIEFCALFEKAHMLYMTRQWAEALEMFESPDMKPKHDDLSVKMYIERCKYYLENPPPKEWDGSYAMTSK